jgi:RNA recognition motif-containing protein
MNIYVSNLSFSMSEAELKNVFSKFGEVESVKIISDRNSGRSKGYGFVQMDDATGQAAIDGLNGIEVEGRTIKVNVAHERTEGEPRGDFGNRSGGGGFRPRTFTKRDDEQQF